MVRNSVFCTTAKIGRGTGGGLVAYHELTSLQSVSDVVLALDADTLNRQGIAGNVFVNDYVACAAMSKIPKADIAFFNGNPFGMTAQYLKNRYSTKIVAAVPAHNLQESIHEHLAFGIDFGFFYPHLVDAFLWDMYTKHIRMADVIVCPSKMSAEWLKANINGGARYEVIAHGVDLPQTKPPPDRFTPCYVGAAGPDKGAYYLLQAWNKLAMQEPELVIAGQGSQQLKELAMRIPSNGARYKVLGYVKDVSTVYDSSSVLIAPSVSEGFNLEVLEMMAHGRPVIVSSGAGASELVEDGVEGFVVPPRDVGQLMRRIQDLHDDPDEIKRMGNNARKKAEKYTWELVRGQYARVLEEL